MIARTDALRRSATVTAIYLGTFMCIMAVSLIGVSLPTIQRDFGLDFASLQWVVGAYTLCLSALMLSSGPLSDRYGRKTAWLFGVTLFLAGSLVAALAPSVGVLIAGRAIQGSGAAFVIPGALSILSHAFPDPVQRARVIGGWSAMSNISLILGPMAGGFLAEYFGGQSVFLSTVPFCALALVLGIVGIRESAAPERRPLDLVGLLLSILFLGLLTFALIRGGKAGWSDPATLAAFGVSAAAFILFLLFELHTPDPLLPVDLFRSGAFSSANYASFVLGFAAYPGSVFFSLLLQQAQHWTAAETGIGLAPVFTATVTVNFLFGMLAARFRTPVLLTLSYVLIGLSLVAIGMVQSPTSPYPLLVPLLIVFGIGLGLAVPVTDVAVMAAAPPGRFGAASAIMNALRQSGMTIGIALLGVILQTRAAGTLAARLDAAGATRADALAGEAVRHHAMPQGLAMARGRFDGLLAEAFSHGFAAIFLAGGALSLTVAAILLLLRRRGAAPALRAGRSGEQALS